MLKLLASLFAGTVFGVGLAISGMINPAKVTGFLDIAGDWDPTLAFVMAGGLIAAAPGFWIARRRSGPLLGGKFNLPAAVGLDTRLLGGAVLFGIGWGLSGLCPGPAIAGLGSGAASSFIFVAAMLAGMLLFRLMPKS